MFGVGHVTKRFGSTVAVDDLSFELGVGEIVALLGQNGAGKSTIIGVLAGLFGQDFDGQLSIGGERYRPLDVADAERNGIVVIAQEINVVPELTVAQTLFSTTSRRVGASSTISRCANSAAEMRWTDSMCPSTQSSRSARSISPPSSW